MSSSTFTFTVTIATSEHYQYAEVICDMIADAAQKRGTGIAKRTPEYIQTKMEEGKAVIAIEDHSGELAGFCYIEAWGALGYVANSGLIVNENFRNQGLALQIKSRAFQLTREKYPNAKLFGITTSLAVMKINSHLGYKPVTFSELTDDEAFWKGCSGCVNYDILQRTNKSICLCTGMLYDPEKEQKKLEAKDNNQ
ncbi:MAG: GNAT family N-acetyltransferase [Bacteroidetes bacterium]|nr:GNAT family N-acetyltransferase [Bacteroidota bacterium]